MYTRYNSSVAQGATSTPRSRIRSEGHRNWIRCFLGLQEIGDSIRPLVDKTFARYWRSWRQCYYTCCTRPDCTQIYGHCHNGTGCNYEDHWVNLNHNHPKGWCCHFNRIKMKGKETWVIKPKPDCDACEKQFTNVKKLFKDPDSSRIYWKNAEFPLWEKGHWEIVKVFMPRGNGYLENAAEAEAIALLTVMNNCKLFHVAGFKSSIVEELISKRNKLTHSVSHEIDNEETEKILKLMTECLEMLGSQCSCFTQKTNLEELKYTEITGDLIKKAHSKKVQGIMNSIGDLAAGGEDISELLDIVESTITLKTEDRYLDEIDKLNKEIITRKDREKELEDSVRKIQVLREEIRKLNISIDEKNAEIRNLTDIFVISSIVLILMTAFFVRIGLIFN